MSLSTKEQEDKNLAWKRAGKGNGLRWLILRDIVAGVATMAMPLEKVQDFLLILRGVSWNTSRTMLNELERLGAVELNVTPDSSTMKKDPYRTYFSATPKGVAIFLRKRSHIPAHLVQAAMITMSASLGEIRDSGEEAEG